MLRVGDSGSPLFGAQRHGIQPRGVPLAVSPRGLVLFGPDEKLPCQLPGDSIGLIHVDVGGAEIRMLIADHPDEATQPGLREVDPIAVQHCLRGAGHDVQAR